MVPIESGAIKPKVDETKVDETVQEPARLRADDSWAVVPVDGWPHTALSQWATGRLLGGSPLKVGLWTLMGQWLKALSKFFWAYGQWRQPANHQSGAKNKSGAVTKSGAETVSQWRATSPAGR